MSREEVFEKLKSIMISTEKNKELKRSEISEDLLLLKDLGFDSIRMLYMAVLIEETFKIRLENIKEMKLQTVGDAVDLVQKKING